MDPQKLFDFSNNKQLKTLTKNTEKEKHIFK